MRKMSVTIYENANFIVLYTKVDDRFAATTKYSGKISKKE